jgi:hypothetical protein
VESPISKTLPTGELGEGEVVALVVAETASVCGWVEADADEGVVAGFVGVGLGERVVLVEFFDNEGVIGFVV